MKDNIIVLICSDSFYAHIQNINVTVTTIFSAFYL